MWPGSELETGARFGDSYQDPFLTSCPEAAGKLIGLKGTGLRVCVRTQFQVTALVLCIRARLQPCRNGWV